MENREKWMRVRIRLIGFCFILAFGFIIARAFHLQVLGQDLWQQKAVRQHQKTIALTPQRGTIFDRNGEAMAVSVEVDSVYVEPTKVEASPKTIKSLAEALSMRTSTIKAKLQSSKGFVWLKRQVAPRESDLVRALDIDGVNYIKEHRRYYPNSEIGAQVIGFTGLDPKGLEGLELEFDTRILGRGGYLVMERDALGRGMSSAGSKIQGGERGNDLFLTLDKNLQYIAEKELGRAVSESKAKSGTVVVLDPRTGAVLAMAGQPDYNPNAFFKFRPGDWRNRALCDSYEPGSTIKVFLMAAALNEGVIRTGQRINCENGSIEVSGKIVHDHRPYKMLTPEEIIKFSSNIGSYKIGKALERERYYNYLRDFGFGQKTEIELPGEVSGLIHKPTRWFDVDLAAISFGQGLAVTPLQLATATAAIANGGYLMSPYVVEKVVDNFGQIRMHRKPQIKRKVIGGDVADQVKEMMVKVTEEGGTGVLGAISGYRVAGKTGTAQKVDPVTGGYAVDKVVSSFVGFAPADDPRVVILVLLDEPKGKAYGGLIAAPVFSRIASQSLRYMKVMPTEKVTRPVLSTIAGVIDTPVDYQVRDVNHQGQEMPQMPDFSGMSYRQVMQVMQNSGLNIKLTGSGRVVAQSPQPGKQIRFGNEIWVKLSPPS